MQRLVGFLRPLPLLGARLLSRGLSDAELSHRYTATRELLTEWMACLCLQAGNGFPE
jgi:hypothetical protein